MQGYTFTCTEEKCSKKGWRQMGVTIQHVLWTGRPVCDMCGKDMTFEGEDESRYDVIRNEVRNEPAIHPRDECDHAWKWRESRNPPYERGYGCTKCGAWNSQS